MGETVFGHRRLNLVRIEQVEPAVDTTAIDGLLRLLQILVHQVRFLEPNSDEILHLQVQKLLLIIVCLLYQQHCPSDWGGRPMVLFVWF